MTAKEYLLQYRKLDIKIKDGIEELQRWQSKAQNITSTFTDVPTFSNSSNSKIALAVEKITELEETLNAEIDYLVSLKTEIQNKLDKLENENFKMLLFKKYILNKSLEQICVDMHYSYDHVKHLHGYALLAFQKYI